ncbi:MAG: TIGR00730 family Rossman fold protein [Deltaproteobacteria bacterium]|nr:MAG: TIGR00730 family Rossman fold protein [Deltaproteobacteria bacterium]
MSERAHLCVFLGSSNRAAPVYFEAARAVGAALVENGLSLVYGGAKVGLMGALADAVLAAGGEARGVIPRQLFDKEVAHEGLTELHVVDSMHERKVKMYEISDAFLALPGGFGTFEELFEITTWAQLGMHQKPIGVLDVNGYYAPLRALADGAVDAGLVAAEHRQILLFGEDPASLVAQLKTHQAPHFDKLIGREET